ncbi:MAG TPA: hypothetical protein VES39_02655 [Rhodospirillales bacterium]|nr:hypothetical protein [Rhodospirillales bacterium]
MARPRLKQALAPRRQQRRLGPRRGLRRDRRPQGERRCRRRLAAGSRWINTAAGRVFVCADPIEGAAVWQPAGPAASRAKAPPEIGNSAGDPANDIAVAAGSCLADEGVPITLAAGITKRLDAAWTAGTGEGGLDTGTKATSTRYSVWLIGKADGTPDALFSLEATAPAMPSGYGYKRWLGWVLTDGSGNILAFRQAGDRFWWKAPRQDAAGVTLSATAGLLTLSVPPSSLARLVALVSHASAVRYVLFSSPDDPDIAASASVHNARCLTSGGAQTAALEIPADASSRIRHRADNSATSLAELMTLGWIDRRGRDQ